MNSDEWIKQYNTINNSFKKRLVFRLGVDSGFFSEYNNMILAMLYCLKHRIRFELYSDHAHFALRDGWKDFFLPFSTFNTHRIHKDYNLRPYIIEQSKEAKLQKIIKYTFITKLYKLLFGVDYMTQDLWAFHQHPDFAQETFSILKLGFDQTSLLSATQQVIKALWRYNAQSAPIIASFSNKVSLPEDYITLHVRAGDKFTEAKTYDCSEHMVLASRFSSNRHVFVMSDDYTVVEQLRTQYPDWYFHTLCTPTERGYYHKEFVKQDKEAKYLHHLRLFAELDIAAAGTRFIGTYSSNIGMFMGMRIGERCYGIDSKKWLLWQG